MREKKGELCAAFFSSFLRGALTPPHEGRKGENEVGSVGGSTVDLVAFR